MWGCSDQFVLFDYQVLEIKVLDDAIPELVEHFDVHLASAESSDGQAGSIPTRYAISKTAMKYIKRYLLCSSSTQRDPH